MNQQTIPNGLLTHFWREGGEGGGGCFSVGGGVCGIQGSAGSPDTAMEGKKREKAAMITKIRGGLDDALED